MILNERSFSKVLGAPADPIPAPVMEPVIQRNP
jgi:hypothetical protein